ncbi:MAG: helix-turn-helix domain-containing protein [Dehalococcoidia bacterium]|nr:helix-turn-helix domain-containing protein [Dehalococcoidia bacterium]
MMIETETDLLTISEAAKLLKISTVTLHRWLKQGRLPAYHLGPRCIRILRSDMAALLTPTRKEEEESMQEEMPIQTELTIRPLGDEQANRIKEFLEQSQSLIDRIRARRHGKPLSPSWRLIRKAREERSKRL